MLSARAPAEKSADMPRRIMPWLASCRSASVTAVLSCAEARSPRSATASERTSAILGLERRHLISAARILALRTFIPAAQRPDRSIETTFYRTALGVSTAFECSSYSVERDRSTIWPFHPCRLKLGRPPSPVDSGWSRGQLGSDHCQCQKLSEACWSPRVLQACSTV